VTALALALGAAGGWGVADFLAGLASRRHAALAVIVASHGVGLVLLGAVEPGLGAGLCSVIGVTTFYRALAVGTMSVIAPIVATSAVVPVIAGLATGERPAAWQLAGIVAALVGVVLAAHEPAGGEQPRRLGAGVALALVAALALGVQLVWLDHAAESDALTGVLASRAVSVSILAVALLGTRTATLPRRALPRVVPLGILDTGANACFALATASGLLALVAVVASLFPVITVGLAHLHLHERLAGPQRLGVGLALIGVVLISVG
jgi:drug/metabolite transporter (DMT)-like permease